MILLDLSSFFLFTALSTFIHYYKALKHSPASTFSVQVQIPRDCLFCIFVTLSITFYNCRAPSTHDLDFFFSKFSQLNSLQVAKT